MDWLDAGSLGASAWGLGVAHPPGEPGWLAPARLAQLIPVGDLAFRLNLFSAAALASCAWPLLALTRALGAPDLRSGGVVVGLALLGFGARMQGQRAEVYALTALLLLGALAVAVIAPGRRGSAATGGLLGLAVGVHPLLAAAATPGLLAARWRRGRGPRDVGPLVAFGAAAFAVYAWLPVRASVVPARSWGVPDSPGRFLDVLLGRGFVRNFGGGDLVANTLLVLERYAVAGAVAAALLAGVGWLARREAAPGDASRNARSGGPAAAARGAYLTALPLWVGGNALTILSQNKVFPTNPDVLGYLLVGTAAVAPLAGLGLGWLREHGPGSRLERLAPLLGLVAVLAVALQAVDGFAADRSDNHLARRFASDQARSLPPGALLLVSGNDSAFLWWWLQRVERRRPDLIVVPRVLLGHPHEERRLRAPLERVGVPWSPALREQPLPLLAAARTPAFLEIRDPELSERGRSLSPHGLVWAVGTAPEHPDLAALRARTLERLSDAVADDEALLVGALLRSTSGGAR